MFKREDFPFLFDSNILIKDMSERLYRLLQFSYKTENEKFFKSEVELMEFLKGKKLSFFRKQRGFGRKSMHELRKWTEEYIEKQKKC